MTDVHWQLDGSSPELYQRYLVPAITTKWAEDLVQPPYRLRPCQGRIFVIDAFEDSRMEFLGPDGEVDELIFHHAYGAPGAGRV